MDGTVKWFSNEKGYGFIAAENGRDHYFHLCDIQGADLVRTGDLVSFTSNRGSKGPKATAVTIISKGAAHAHRSQKQPNRTNNVGNASVFQPTTHFMGIVVDAQRQVLHHISGGGSVRFGNPNYIKPIETEIETSTSLWVRDVDGKEKHFEIDAPVAVGHKVSIFYMESDSLFTVAIYNYNSGDVYEFMPRTTDSSLGNWTFVTLTGSCAIATIGNIHYKWMFFAWIFGIFTALFSIFAIVGMLLPSNDDPQKWAEIWKFIDSEIESELAIMHR